MTKNHYIKAINHLFENLDNNIYLHRYTLLSLTISDAYSESGSKYITYEAIMTEENKMNPIYVNGKIKVKSSPQTASNTEG